MSHRSLKLSRLHWLPLLLAGLGACTGSLAASWPGGLQGHWEVSQVAVDGKDQAHWQYFPDDPRLLGRQLAISDSSIALNNDSRDCSKPVSAPLPANKLQSFVGQQLPRPAAFETPTRPTLSDFDLKMPDAPVSPVRVNCSPDNSSWNGAWFVPISSDSLLTNYDNSGYILVLRRSGDKDPIKASFACSKAHGGTEQAICSSAALAGYDRSVAAAYHRALGTSDDAASLRQEQIAWIKTRNACAADAVCLEKSMRERVDQLMQQ